MKELRGFGPAGWFAFGSILLTGTILIHHIAIPAGALLALLWVKFSCTPWREMGYTKPASWAQTIVTGMVLGCAFKLLTKAVVMPLLGAGPVNLTYRHLAGNSTLLPFAIWTMLVAGFAEETVYRGFLFERFRKLFGEHRWTSPVIVFLTSILFGLAHLPTQGHYGVVHGIILGLVFGTIYALKKNIFFLMIAHAAYDLLALALIYWNIEREVSLFFFT